MNRHDILLSARLERERAQKAQYTAMVLRAYALQTREECHALRVAFQAYRDARAERVAEPA
jgi:hypothetical protein